MNDKLYTLDPSETMDELQQVYFPPYITLAHMFHAFNGWTLGSRVLKQYQLQYVVEGAADYTIEGIHYRTEKGDLLFHSPGELHYVNTIEGTPYVCISVVFHFGNIDYPVRELINVGVPNWEKPHHMGNYSEWPLENRLSELVHYYGQPGLYPQQRAQQLLMDILLSLAETSYNRESEHAEKESSGMAKLILVRNYIDAHLREGFRHEQLEQLTGWSRNYVISQFKRVFGMPPGQYLLWIRLEKAKQLALQSGDSFGEIAEKVGYSDIHSFGRSFKRKTRMSLSQFVSTLFRDTPDR